MSGKQNCSATQADVSTKNEMAIIAGFRYDSKLGVKNYPPGSSIPFVMKDHLGCRPLIAPHWDITSIYGIVDHFITTNDKSFGH